MPCKAREGVRGDHNGAHWPHLRLHDDPRQAARRKAFGRCIAKLGWIWLIPVIASTNEYFISVVSKGEWII